MTKKIKAAEAAIPFDRRKLTENINQKQAVYDFFSCDPRLCSRWSGTCMWCALTFAINVE